MIDGGNLYAPEREAELTTLFGAWSLIREWGWIGSPGQVRAEPQAGIDELEAEAARIATAKRRKGYR